MNDSTKQRNPYWKAALAVVDAWGDDMLASPVFKTIRRVSRSVDAIQQLRADLRAARYAGGGDTGQHAIEALQLVILSTTGAVDALITSVLPEIGESRIVYEGSWTKLLEVTAADGTRMWLDVYERTVTGTDGRFHVRNVWHERGQADVVIGALSAVVWNGIRGSAVELRAATDSWGNRETRLELMPLADDYVTSDNGTLSLLEQIAARTQMFYDAGVTRRILLAGPPGTGKTTLARHLTDRFGGRLVQVNGRDVADGGGNHAMQVLSLLRPSLVLLDDLDRCEGAVEDLMSTLSRLSQTGQPMVIVGTVNVIDRLDPALLRPGRFDELHQVPEPSDDYRMLVVKHYIQKYTVGISADRASEAMRGFSPADIREVMLSTGTVGPQVFDIEVERVRRQREHYAGDACAKYMSRPASNRAGTMHNVPVPE